MASVFAAYQAQQPWTITTTAKSIAKAIAEPNYAQHLPEYIVENYYTVASYLFLAFVVYMVNPHVRAARNVYHGQRHIGLGVEVFEIIFEHLPIRYGCALLGVLNGLQAVAALHIVLLGVNAYQPEPVKALSLAIFILQAVQTSFFA